MPLQARDQHAGMRTAPGHMWTLLAKESKAGKWQPSSSIKVCTGGSPESWVCVPGKKRPGKAG